MFTYKTSILQVYVYFKCTKVKVFIFSNLSCFSFILYLLRTFHYNIIYVLYRGVFVQVCGCVNEMTIILCMYSEWKIKKRSKLKDKIKLPSFYQSRYLPTYQQHLHVYLLQKKHQKYFEYNFITFSGAKKIFTHITLIFLLVIADVLFTCILRYLYKIL